MKSKLTRIASLLAVCAVAISLAACAKGSMNLELLDEVSGVKVTAENAGTSESVTSAGAIVVSKGDHITISPVFSKGSVRLSIISSSGRTTAYDEEVSGKQLFSIEAKPGQYDVKVTGNGATGSLVVFAESDSAVDAANKAIDDMQQDSQNQLDDAKKDLEKTSEEVKKVTGEAEKELADATAEANKIADEVAKDQQSEQK